MTPPPHAEFRDILFGYAAAETEGARAPELLLEGFLDDERLVDKAIKGDAFLFLGYKGSGKSAIAQRARLLADNNPELFVRIQKLSDFSYGDFKTAAGGQGDRAVRYPAVWGFLLLATMMQSLHGDQGLRSSTGTDFAAAVNGLKALGVWPVPALSSLATMSSKRAFKGSIPKFFEAQSETAAQTQDLQINQLVQALERVIRGISSRSRHLLFIDGLDEIFSQRDLQFASLAALVQECDRLNASFVESGAPCKIVVLCRTDIFDRLPGSNTNKSLQESSEEIEWYGDPREPDRARILRLIRKRAEVSLRRQVKLFDEYIPKRIDGRESRRVLLDHTRHTPRDAIELFRNLQSFADHEPLLAREVKSGIRSYSRKYFLRELKDELAGYLPTHEIDRAVGILTTLGKQRFTLMELEAKREETRVGDVPLETLGRVLFDCSGVGMVTERDGQPPLYTFKYRNPNAVFVPSATLWLHPGVMKALNIEVGPRNNHRRAKRGQTRYSRDAAGQLEGGGVPVAADPKSGSEERRLLAELLIKESDAVDCLQRRRLTSEQEL